VDPPDRLGERRGHRQHVQLRVHGRDRDWHRVRADDLDDVLARGQLVQRPVGEQAVGAGHADRADLLLAQPVEQLEHGGAARDLVVEHDHVPAGHVADDGRDRDLGVVVAFLRAGRDRHAQATGERGGALGVAEVRRHHHRVGQVPAAEVRGQFAQRVQVVDRDREEPVHLRRVQGEGEHPVDAGGDQQVGDQPSADGDPGLVLLVGPGVGVVRHDRGHPGGGGAAGRVRHQQQLHQVLLYRRHQRLDQEHVPFPAVGLELHLEAVVGEPGDPDRPLRLGQVHADLGGQRGVRAAAEHRDVTHRRAPAAARRRRSSSAAG
jgi:hypothetical protein